MSEAMRIGIIGDFDPGSTYHQATTDARAPWVYAAALVRRAAVASNASTSKGSGATPSAPHARACASCTGPPRA
jgi:hypothetical protein